MNKIKNKEGITSITMYPTAYTLCEIGQDWYKSNLEIIMEPNEVYPDYMEVKDFISENIDGKVMNIETVIEKIYDHLMNEYEPTSLKVINHVRGCRTHFDVDVVKE